MHDRAREALKASILLADGGGAAYAPLKARAEALLAGPGAEGGRGEEGRRMSRDPHDEILAELIEAAGAGPRGGPALAACWFAAHSRRLGL